MASGRALHAAERGVHGADDGVGLLDRILALQARELQVRLERERLRLRHGLRLLRYKIAILEPAPEAEDVLQSLFVVWKPVDLGERIVGVWAGHRTASPREEERAYKDCVELGHVVRSFVCVCVCVVAA